MRAFWKSAFLLSVVVSASVSAQNYPMPRSAVEPPAICTGCPGTNSSGQANDGLPTFPYDTPLSLHKGRFVDSTNTPSYQSPIRTIRAGLVRVAPAAQNRIYLALGGIVGAYTLDTFFSDKLAQGMVALNTLFTGPWGGRTVFEKLAKPDRYFYAESSQSGWSTPLFDIQDVLYDFDADDRGYLYVGTVFGWGIASDPGGADGTHLPFVAQVSDGVFYANDLFSLNSGPSYFVYYSDSQNTALYDVTTAASPVVATMRSGSSNAFRAWSKYEAGQRVALINMDGHARVYTYADLIAGAAPLADLTPSAGKSFQDLSFDDAGNLWLAEGSGGVSFNVLREAIPSGGGYTTTTFDVYGPAAFTPRTIHASGGYIAIAGQVASAHDLRLLRVVGGSPQLQDTNGFVEKYYYRAPSGYAQPGFEGLRSVRLVTQGSKTYLFLSNHGLGDVYELSDAPRITSMTPLAGDIAGGTEVTIYGSGFSAGSTVTFDGITASSTYLGNHLTAVAPPHAIGPVDVVVSAAGEEPMTAPQQFTYELPGPANLTATATGTTTVSIAWNPVPGATRYEVSRLASNAVPQSWTVIGIVTGTALGDTDRTAEATYLYRVRAGDDTAFSGKSSIDAVTMMNPSSATIVAGTLIRAEDLTNLRTRVNGVRTAAGLSPYSFSDQPPILISAIHITELRTRLTQARTALGLTTPAFTDPALSGVVVKAVHFNELLDLMR